MMIKISFFFLLTVLVFSCGTKTHKKPVIDRNGPKIAIVEKIIQDSTISRILISSNKIDTSELTIRYQYFINVDEVWKDSVNLAIANFALTNCGINRLKSGVNLNSTVFLEAITNLKKDAEEDYLDSEFSTLWYFESSGFILDERKNFVTVSNSVNVYSGGAHPNSYFENQNIDKKDGHVLKIEEIVSDLEEFNRIAEKCFREQNGFSPEESLEEIGFWFEDNIFKVNSNFSFKDDKILFFFNNYEVGPYSMGSFDFSVPFTLSKHLFKIDLSKN